MTGILWFLFWQTTGILLCRLPRGKAEYGVRVWLGSLIGSLLAIWVPIPFSFLLGFTKSSHLVSLIVGVIGLGFILFLLLKRGHMTDEKKSAALPAFLCLFVPFMVLWCYLLWSHTLLPVGDAIYTGQCTYGDMNMHLGFITSIAEQGYFPPEYSILPGEKLCYPFLCDTVSSSLYLLGTPLRLAYIVPMLFAFAQVLCGAWFLARAFCKKVFSAVLTFILFFLNGGLGIIYFFKDYNFHDLLTGFYITPTNLTVKGIRWVNVIVDMLLPQRATLFGWAGLFGALYLLYLAVFKGFSRCYLPAGIIGGLLPMIHTHSFFALGLVAMAWMFCSALRDGVKWSWFKGWLYFGIPAVAIALPQLFLWTFTSVSGNAQFLRYNFDWVNGGQENWWWFWLKNVGPVFLLAPLAFLCGDKETRMVFSGSVLIFVICEFLVFQPNVYDDNKLLYIGYYFACLLSARFLGSLFVRLHSPRTKAVLMAVFLLITTNAGVLSLLREVVSGIPAYGYELFSSGEAAAAEFIRENCPANSVFLTEDNHDNAVAVLTGRNIVCGSSAFLYYHGVDYTANQAMADAMLTDSDVFETYRNDYHIDYVFISGYERALTGCIEGYLAATYPCIFSKDGVNIYQLNG